MTIELYCQHCGQHMQIADQYAGQTGKCKNCGGKLSVPTRSSKSQALPSISKKTSATLYVWFAGAALVTVVLALGIYLFVSRDSSLPTDTSPEAPSAQRIVEFPADRAVGFLTMRDKGAPLSWINLGDAQGPVLVPEGKELGLFVRGRDPLDLAYLLDFAPNDLGVLVLEHPSMTNGQLRNVEHLTGLTALLVEYCDLTDAGLRSFQGLTNLEFIGLGGTKITDAGLATLTTFRHLKGLSLGGTRITERGIRSLKSLPALETIMLSGMALSRPMVDALKDIPGLIMLRIDSGRPPDANRIPGGDRPTSLDSILLLREITQLQTLTLDGKLHDDSLIPALSQLTHLKKIEFGKTSITQVGKNELKRALPNCEIAL